MVKPHELEKVSPRALAVADSFTMNGLFWLPEENDGLGGLAIVSLGANDYGGGGRRFKLETYLDSLLGAELRSRITLIGDSTSWVGTRQDLLLRYPL